MDHESLQYCPYAAGTRGLVISLCRWATDWPPAIIYHPGIKTPSWVEVFWPLRHDGAVTQSAPVSFFAASQITAVCLTAARSGLPAKISRKSSWNRPQSSAQSPWSVPRPEIAGRKCEQAQQLLLAHQQAQDEPSSGEHDKRHIFELC